MKSKFLLVILCLLGVLGNSFSQTNENPDPIKMAVTKNDGTIYIGFILEDDGRELLLNTEEIGKIYIPKSLIKKIETYDSYLKNKKDSDEEIKKEEPNNPVEEVKKEEPKDTVVAEPEMEEEKETASRLTTKYIQSDNAYPLRRGEAFVKLMPVGLEAQIPLMKNWSMGVMTSYLGAPLALKSKLSFKVFDSSYFSVDVMYGSMIFGSLFNSGASDGGALVSTGFTFGNRKTNFTIRGGYGLIHQLRNTGFWNDTTGFFTEGPDVFQLDQFGIANFGGIINISDKLDIVLDLFGVFGSGTTLVTGAAALRFGPSPQHRFQTGLAVGITNFGAIPVPVPLLSYTFVFDQRTGSKNF